MTKTIIKGGGKSDKKMKKTLNIIKNVLVWLILLTAIGMMIFTVFSVNTFDRNNRRIFGYSFFIVRTDSMSATDFDSGDIVIMKKIDPTVLKEGDIIAYISQNKSNFGETVTHKIRTVTTTENGDLGFVTYGTTTDTNDEKVVEPEFIIGKYVGKMPNVGKFFAFLQTTPGYILCILIPFLLIILYSAFNCFLLFKQYKKEQAEEIAAEREKLEEERRRSAEMKAELEALRSKLAEKNGQD